MNHPESSKNIEYKQYTEQRMHEDVIRKPGLLWLEITPSCNLNCVHCYTESSSLLKTKDVLDWNCILIEAKKIGFTKVQFIGGEPTLHPKLPEFIENAHRLGYNFIEVYSNLTMVSDSLLDNFKRYNVNIATSFYSQNEEVHEKITSAKGSFRKTVEGIKKVLNARIPLRVGIVTMKLNEGEFEKSVEFLASLGVDKNKIRNDVIRSEGRGSNITECRNMEDKLCGECWKGNLTVSWDGVVFPCVFSREVIIGNIREQSIMELNMSHKLQDFREFSYKSSLKKKVMMDCNPDLLRCDPHCNPGLIRCDPDYG